MAVTTNYLLLCHNKTLFYYHFMIVLDSYQCTNVKVDYWLQLKFSIDRTLNYFERTLDLLIEAIINLHTFNIEKQQVTMFLNITDMPVFQGFMPTNNELAYITTMSQVITKIYIFYSVIFWVHLLIVIPGNFFSIITITKNKTLWTPSNIVLSINALFMMIGSVVGLFVRPSAYPLMLFDETQRVTAYSVAWWTYTLSFRIGNNR